MSAMTDIDSPGTVSITDRVREVALDAPLIGVAFLGAKAIFIGAEECAYALGDTAASAEIERISLHNGGILCAASDARRIVTGGDDGQVVMLHAGGRHEIVVSDKKHRWIDNVALHADGGFAWSAGRTAFALAPKGEIKSLDVASTVGGLAFAPKGFRLAIARYNGVTLWFPNMQGTPEELEWKGSHLAVQFSPDGKFICTSMHEPAMHGWRIADGRHMRMTGYPGRVKSFNWSCDGKWMATSGADCAILWPFQSKDGPIGKAPAQHAPLDARVSCVACNPRQTIYAAGYGDGTVLLVRIEDGAEILVRRPDPDKGAVVAMAWDTKGETLAMAAENGAAGIVSLA